VVEHPITRLQHSRAFTRNSPLQAHANLAPFRSRIINAPLDLTRPSPAHASITSCVSLACPSCSFCLSAQETSSCSMPKNNLPSLPLMHLSHTHLVLIHLSRILPSEGHVVLTVALRCQCQPLFCSSWLYLRAILSYRMVLCTALASSLTTHIFYLVSPSASGCLLHVFLPSLASVLRKLVLHQSLISLHLSTRPQIISPCDSTRLL
jgi:hypothetical protein